MPDPLTTQIASAWQTQLEQLKAAHGIRRVRRVQDLLYAADQQPEISFRLTYNRALGAKDNRGQMRQLQFLTRVTFEVSREQDAAEAADLWAARVCEVVDDDQTLGGLVITVDFVEDIPFTEEFDRANHGVLIRHNLNYRHPYGQPTTQY